MHDLKIALESNSFTYLLQAMESGSRPLGSEAEEKVALLRLFLYRDDIFYITPTAKLEVSKIEDKLKLQAHNALESAHLGLLEIPDFEKVNKLAEFYQQFHSGKKNASDCKIVAEAEISKCDYLLSYDKKLVNKLLSKTENLQIKYPSCYWSSLAIPKGVAPKWIPEHSNPLGKETWWVW